MARKKKEEIIEEVIETKEQETVDYGSGMTRINNMIQAGFRPTDPEVKKDE